MKNIRTVIAGVLGVPTWICMVLGEWFKGIREVYIEDSLVPWSVEFFYDTVTIHVSEDDDFEETTAFWVEEIVQFLPRTILIILQIFFEFCFLVFCGLINLINPDS